MGVGCISWVGYAPAAVLWHRGLLQHAAVARDGAVEVVGFGCVSLAEVGYPPLNGSAASEQLQGRLAESMAGDADAKARILEKHAGAHTHKQQTLTVFPVVVHCHLAIRAHRCGRDKGLARHHACVVH